MVFRYNELQDPTYQYKIDIGHFMVRIENLYHLWVNYFWFWFLFSFLLWGKFNAVKLSGTVEITGQLLNLTVVFSLFLFQGLKVFFFTVGAIYLVYLVYLLFRAYSELRAMPYFGKEILWCCVMVKVLASVSFGDAGQRRFEAYKNTTWTDNTLHYTDTGEIAGFCRLLKNHIFIARSEDTNIRITMVTNIISQL